MACVCDGPQETNRAYGPTGLTFGSLLHGACTPTLTFGPSLLKNHFLVALLPNKQNRDHPILKHLLDVYTFN